VTSVTIAGLGALAMPPKDTLKPAFHPTQRTQRTQHKNRHDSILAFWPSRRLRRLRSLRLLRYFLAFVARVALDGNQVKLISAVSYWSMSTHSAASGNVSPANAGDKYSVYISIPVPRK